MCLRQLHSCLLQVAGTRAATDTPVKTQTTGSSMIANRLNARFPEHAPMTLCRLVAQ